jgi:hypothetical protein
MKDKCKKILQRICDTALHVYLLRNSAYMYIQCMGTQMRYFVEAVIEEEKEGKKLEGPSLAAAIENREKRITEKAFLKFAWF